MSVLSGPYTKSWVWQYLIANTDTTDMDKRLSACCYSTKVASGSVTDRHTSDMTSFISIWIIANCICDLDSQDVWVHLKIALEEVKTWFLPKTFTETEMGNVKCFWS